MKITIEVNCSPEEARRAMGLPDVAAMQEGYLRQLTAMTEAGFKPEALEAMLTGWSPFGEAGMGLWRALAASASMAPSEPPR